MKKSIYRFSSYLSNFIISIFTCFIAAMTYIFILWGDEQKLIAIILSILLLTICIGLLYYSFRYKIVIKEHEIIYVGFRKHIILKEDILNIDLDGVRIIIETKNKTYYVAGYVINKSWNIEKNINKNKHLINIIKESLNRI